MFKDACGCCNIESMVTVDERGQMVLPKKIRTKAGIKNGDKLAVVSWRTGGKVCGIILVKTTGMEAMVLKLLGPIANDIMNTK